MDKTFCCTKTLGTITLYIGSRYKDMTLMSHVGSLFRRSRLQQAKAFAENHFEES